MGQDSLAEHKINCRYRGWTVVNITCCQMYSNQASILDFHWLRKLVVQFTCAYCPSVNTDCCTSPSWPRLKTVCRTCEKCVNSVLQTFGLNIIEALTIIQDDKELLLVWIISINSYHIDN